MVCNVVLDAQRDVLLWEAALMIDSLFALGAVLPLDLLSVLDEELLMLQLPYGQRLQRMHVWLLAQHGQPSHALPQQ